MQKNLNGLAAVYAAAGVTPPSNDLVSRSDFDAAITSAFSQGEKAGMLKGRTKIAAEAQREANTRSRTIIEHAEATGCAEAVAHRLAFDSDMGTDQAIGWLNGLSAQRPGSQARPPASLEGNLPDPKLAAFENTPDQSAAASWDTALKNAGLEIKGA